MQFNSPEEKKRCFEKLVKEYAPRLYRQIISIVLNHDDADDILQDVFVKVWQNLDRFREEAHIHTWLYRIAHNETLGFLRRRRLRSFFPLSVHHHQKLHTEIFTGFDKAGEVFYKAVDDLPPRQKMIFHYRYFQQLPYEEIARITGLTEGALKASFHHAVKKIQEALKHLH